MTHPRTRIHLPRHLGEQASDALTAFVGSWAFLGLHTVWFAAWITIPVEPYPFGLLTMIVSLEAIFLSTLVMMSQNRTAAKDHLRDELEAQEVTDLWALNQRQMQVLTILHEWQAKGGNHDQSTASEHSHGIKQ